jgi:hypothetical protein
LDELGLKALEAGLDGGAYERPPVWEAPVHRWRRDSRFGRHGPDRQPFGVTVRGQYPHRGVDQFAVQPVAGTAGIARAGELASPSAVMPQKVAAPEAPEQLTAVAPHDAGMRMIIDDRCPRARRGTLVSAQARAEGSKRKGLTEVAVDVLEGAVLVVGGFTACAEFGSYAFVHPVIRRLPATYHIKVEQGLVRTFGRVMPVLMTVTVALGVANAIADAGQGGPAGWRWAAAAAYIAALTSTVIFNVPVNLATGRWDAQHPPDNWKQARNRWEFFQGLRSWLLLTGFVLTCIGFAAG